MSYILDALKKSEAQRHAGTIPTVVAPHGAPIESPRTGRLGTLGWIVAALAMVLGAAWWARQYLERPAHDVTASPAAPVAPIPAPARAENAAAPGSGESARGGEAIPRLKLAISLPTREQPAREPVGESSPAATTASAPPPPVTVAPAPAQEAAPPRATLLLYGELPPTIRQALPPLVVGGFAAGDSGGNMAMVDDRLVHEGEELAPGIRVEKILPDRVEFSYKGYRFRR
ncbi:MAG: general secretion pathway protein GspB [Sterolibacteriaceae bacterium]|nr:general secretion pathway protein GspB [Sterolibacteriaceae bacterium]MBK9086538.1 general secretion pathway protein GspB [Sterolibacteriaceae bacterium]